MARKKKGNLLLALGAFLFARPKRPKGRTRRPAVRELDVALERGRARVARERAAVRDEARAREAADRARVKAERLRERQLALEEKATRARTKTARAESASKARTAGKRIDRLEDLEARISRGDLKGAELKELIDSGTLNLRRNPRRVRTL